MVRALYKTPFGILCCSSQCAPARRPWSKLSRPQLKQLIRCGVPPSLRSQVRRPALATLSDVSTTFNGARIIKKKTPFNGVRII